MRLRLLSVVVLIFAVTVHAAPSRAADGDDDVPSRPRRLVIAFASLRDRPAFSNLYFYRHDGVGRGEVAGTATPQFERADSHPSLTADGTSCAYASKQVGGFSPLINFWNLRENRSLPPAPFNSDPGARIEPSLSGGGKLLAFCARGHAGSVGGWDVVLFDMAAAKFVDLPGLNSEYDEREAFLGRNGRFLAYVTNRSGGAGLSDVALYDREAQKAIPLPGLNSESREINPALSADGSFLAFVSDRPGGAGGKDVYLYDRHLERLVDLPGLNSVAHDQTPALSSDGRFLAFVSERTSGAGERDIFLYDRQFAKLLPTPGLNSKQEDFDPALAYDDGE